MSLPIPEVREILYNMAREMKADASPHWQNRGVLLEYLIAEMYRRPPVAKAPVSAAPITERIKADVRRVHDADPNLRMDQIGAMFNISQGRVSEILHPK